MLKKYDEKLKREKNGESSEIEEKKKERYGDNEEII